MNITTFLATLAFYLGKYFPEQLDQPFKPQDSADCVSCRDIKYDYIIVGAGSAGCVLANRLTANPKKNVLLIEAGDDESYISDTPFYALSFNDQDLRYDWNYSITPQQHKCAYTRGMCILQRGKIMGGSSTINELLYVRGTAEDYDKWESIGNPGWDYRHVFPYFLKSEHTAIPEFQNSPYHSTTGPQYVGYGVYSNKLFQDLFTAGIEYGLSVNDYNAEYQKGISRPQQTVNGPTRCSASKAYLNPIRDRNNLYIFKNTLVTKILFSADSKTVTGVRCITNGEEYSVFTKNEIILSAGAVNTPKLLMLSGVGPKQHLEELGIPVYHDLPVGNNLMDHPTVILNFTIQSQMENFTDSEATNAIIEYAKCRRGVVSSSTSVMVLFLNSTSEIVDTELLFGVVPRGLTNNNGPSVLISVTNIKPKSKGSIRLKSTNFEDPPIIDPKYFNVSSDRDQVIWGIKQTEKIMGKAILAKYSPTLAPTYPVCNYNQPLTDSDIECILNNDIANGYHLCGTAKMGPKDDNTTVVDSKLRVHGVANLRVIDASIFPFIPSGNTNAPTIMVAEKAADIILNEII